MHTDSKDIDSFPSIHKLTVGIFQQKVKRYLTLQNKISIIIITNI